MSSYERRHKAYRTLILDVDGIDEEGHTGFMHIVKKTR